MRACLYGGGGGGGWTVGYVDCALCSLVLWLLVMVVGWWLTCPPFPFRAAVGAEFGRV